MLKYILKRILQAIPVLLGVSVIVFLIMRVFSADPAPVVVGPAACNIPRRCRHGVMPRALTTPSLFSTSIFFWCHPR